MSTTTRSATTGAKTVTKDVQTVDNTATGVGGASRENVDPSRWNRVGRLGRYDVDVRLNPVSYNTGILSTGRTVRKSRGRRIIDYSSDSSSSSDSDGGFRRRRPTRAVDKTVVKSDGDGTKVKQVSKTGTGAGVGAGTGAGTAAGVAAGTGAGVASEKQVTKAVDTGAGITSGTGAKEKQVAKTVAKDTGAGTAVDTGSGIGTGAGTGAKEKQVTKTVAKDTGAGTAVGTGSGTGTGAGTGTKEKQVTKTVANDTGAGTAVGTGSGTGAGAGTTVGNDVDTNRATVGSTRGSVGNTSTYGRRGAPRIGYGSSNFIEMDTYRTLGRGPNISEYAASRYNYLTVGPREIPTRYNYLQEFDYGYAPRRRRGRQVG